VPSLSVVVVSYNNIEDIRTCVESALAATTAPIELIVVDNASRDASADVVAAIADARVRLVRLRHNIGFGRACNLAVSRAVNDIVVLLNPDTVVQPGALDALAAHVVAHPRDVPLGGRTLSPDGTLDPQSCWGAPTLWSTFCTATGLTSAFRGSRLFDPEALGGWRRDDIRPVGVVTGCLLAMPRTTWQEIGGFDPRYFVYGEDADLSVRARRLGYRPTITPAATIVHKVGASSETRADKYVLLFAGKLTFVDVNWTGAKRAAARVLIRGGVALRALAAVLTSDRVCREWRRTWLRRAQWQHGFPEIPDPSNADLAEIDAG
jgi:GT2 family glycosyltransferase